MRKLVRLAIISLLCAQGVWCAPRWTASETIHRMFGAAFQILFPILNSASVASGPTINAGFEYRGSSGYVSTLSGDVFVGAPAGSCVSGPPPCYPTTATIGGFVTTYGWHPEATFAGWPTCNGIIFAFDRNSGVDARLAGIAGTGDCIPFGVDVTAGASYDLIFAAGDANSSQGPFTLKVYDGASTVLATVVNNSSNGSGQWFDAGGNLRTSASDWVTNGSITKLTVTPSTTRLSWVLSPAAAATGYMSYFHIASH